jgi:O-antigen/teichoic acid export membrane protein
LSVATYTRLRRAGLDAIRAGRAAFRTRVRGHQSNGETAVGPSVGEASSCESSRSRRFGRLGRVGAKAALALLDQALFAGTNFGVSIFLARLLTPTEYGIFATSFSILLLIAAFHSAVFTEPLMVFGAGKFALTFSPYLRGVLSAHWTITGTLAAAVAGMVLVSGRSHLGPLPDLAAPIVASPALLYYWTLRRAPYATGRLGVAPIASVGYLALTLCALATAHALGRLSSTAVWASLACAGLLTGAWLQRQMTRGCEKEPAHRPLAVLREHWRLAKWSLPAVMAYWAAGQVQYVTIPVFVSLEDLAGYYAMANLYRPLHSVMQSATSLLLPTVARMSAATGSVVTKELSLLAARTALAAAAVVALYVGILLLAQPLVIQGLYGGKYADYFYFVPFLGMMAILSAVIQAATAVLRGLGRTRPVFNVWLLAAAVNTVGTVPALLLTGIHGALIVGVVAFMAGALVAQYHLHGQKR